MRVEPASSGDLSAVRAAYADARKFQRERGAILWPAFPDMSILAEVEAGRLIRVMDGDVLVGVFSFRRRRGTVGASARAALQHDVPAPLRALRGTRAAAALAHTA